MSRSLLTGLGTLLLCSGIAQADPGFKPNGSIGLTQTFYGNSGGYKTATAHPSLSLNYNFAPKWNLNLVWDRTWGLYDDYTGAPNQQYEYFSQPAGTLTYNYGKLGDSKVNWSSSVMFENQTNMTGTSTNYVYGQTFFDFSEYLPRSEFLKATQFALAPQYVHAWNSQGGSGSINTAGIGLLTNWDLPGNFSFTLNAYAFKDWYSGALQISGPNGNYSSANYFVALAWLQYQNTLFKFDQNTSLSFNFIGGLDPFMASNRNGSWEPFIASNAQYEWLGPTVQAGNFKSTYILFALPQLMLTYNVNDKLSFNVFVQVKYSNQVWGDSVGGWSFQPQGGFGVTYNF
ncbi:FomA family porin-like outer membrane protein [Orrella marina]|uniref:Major outer membrane protein n=1 Tax=Orrella marina TaxID=2163011 RepID=A0A2R4XH52_9BURK|nr:hypothetical protein [Orrella marina]AWB33136.1 hypothetical protein DBV39_04770 [Orrella marina]